MNNQKQNERELRDAIRAFIKNPAPLNQAADEALVDSMYELAHGLLDDDPEARGLAIELRDTDEEAAALYGLFASGESAILVEFRQNTGPALEQFFEQEWRGKLAAEGDYGSDGKQEDIRKIEIPFGQFTAVGLIRQRSDESYELLLTLPAATGLQASQLQGLTLKIVDRPNPIIFNSVKNGAFEARVVLPAMIDGPFKQIILAPIDESPRS